MSEKLGWLRKNDISYCDEFFLSVSKKIPSRPDFIFCIQVFCTAYKKKTVWIYTSNGNSPITFPHTCLGKNYVFIQAAVKSKQSLILYHTFVSTSQLFQANKITFRNSARQGAVIAGDCETKFHVDRRFNPKKNTNLTNFKWITLPAVSL